MLQLDFGLSLVVEVGDADCHQCFVYSSSCLD
jgi:hypothetical protein